MHRDLQFAFECGWLPVTPAIWTGDGSGIRVLDVILPFAGERGGVVAGESISLAEAVGESSEGWVDIGAIATCTDDDRDLRVDVGDGGFGGDGYVAVLTCSTGKLRWVAFFDESNPFLRVNVDRDFVVAVSELGHEWRFPINDPAAVTIGHA